MELESVAEETEANLTTCRPSKMRKTLLLSILPISTILMKKVAVLSSKTKHEDRVKSLRQAEESPADKRERLARAVAAGARSYRTIYKRLKISKHQVVVGVECSVMELMMTFPYPNQT